MWVTYVYIGAGLGESNDSGSDAVEGVESGGDGSSERGTRKTRRKRRKQYVCMSSAAISLRYCVNAMFVSTSPFFI